MRHYVPRIVDRELDRALDVAGAVSIKGARATGKTETARQRAASELRLDSASARAALARSAPATALDGQVPRLLDEWQLVPGLWNEVRHDVDERRAPGQFILTGSASPDDDPLRHSGAGRFLTVMMRTMTLSETGHSSGVVGLATLLDGQFDGIVEGQAGLDEVAERIVTGGWPGWYELGQTAARARVRAYVEEIAEHDFPTVSGVRRDPRRFTAYLRALAGLVAQPSSFAALTRRMHDEFTADIGPAAVPALHDLAERMFLVEDQLAWAPRLRSRQAAAKAPVRHLADPSLAASLLGASAERLLAEPATLGFLFESQVVHDLRVYAQAIGARGVYHYRDVKGRDEIDVVVEGFDGAWVGVEVKLGYGQVDAAARNLRRVASKIEREPTELVVVTPTGVAHRRADGVLVVPVTVLGV